MPPTLSVCNTDSLGEQIQAAFPHAKVVKTLNTTNCLNMVDPGRIPGAHDIFICGDDNDAKKCVKSILESFGWTIIHDLGGITMSRGTEQLLPLWVRLWESLGHGDFNFHVVTK